MRRDHRDAQDRRRTRASQRVGAEQNRDDPCCQATVLAQGSRDRAR